MTNQGDLAGPGAVDRGADTQPHDAGWALALGAASILFCAPVTGPLAIWKATVALRSGQSELPAIAAILLALVGLATSAFLWFLAIWQLLYP